MDARETQFRSVSVSGMLRNPSTAEENQGDDFYEGVIGRSFCVDEDVAQYVVFNYSQGKKNGGKKYPKVMNDFPSFF